MDSSLSIRCPSCARQLKFPAAAKGKSIKCPVCKSIFKINAEDNPSPAVPQLEIDPVAIAPRSPEPPPLKSDPDTSPEGDAVDPPRRRRNDDDDERDDRPRRPQWDEEDRPARRRRRSNYDDDYDDYEDARAYRRRQRRMDDAISSVQAPAIMLIILGFLEFGASLLALILCVTMPAPHQGDREAKLVFGIGGFIGVFWSAAMLVGAFMMKSMRSYGFALTASIMAVIPFTICNLGIGLWSIIVLCNADVKRAFEKKQR
jgi:phage FluMu protein Com